VIQAKLSVNQPGDRFEQQADRMADAVMRMPEPRAAQETGGSGSTAIPRLQRICPECQEEVHSVQAPIQRVCSECEEKLNGKPEGKLDLRAKELPGHTSEVTPGTQARIDALHGGGHPLPESERAFFEPRFGRDFGQVRLHTDSRAAESARTVNARAFTVGRNVVLGAGEYAPGNTEGRRLLAHELAHVIQQRAIGRTARPEGTIQRQEPVTTITFGAVVAKCILGAIAGVLFDAAIQAIIYSIKERTWRFWRATWDYCSLVLSAVIGCIAAPISAATLEPWITARLGPALGGISGTLLGKVLLFIAKKLAIGIPKFIVKSLAKLGCISPEQAAELGVTRDTPEEPPEPAPVPVPLLPPTTTCKPMTGDVTGDVRVLMKVNTAELLTPDEEVKLDKFADSLRGTDAKVKVHGLASTDGPADFNDRLSCSRALRGTQLLRDRGIPDTQIVDVFKHGEVSGPYEWQRSVVFERVGPGPTPTPPGPSPTPPTPPTPAISLVKLKSIRFSSDHGGRGAPIIKNNHDDWSAKGSAYPAIEWQSAKPDDTAPISHDMGKNVEIEVVLDVPKDTRAAPFTLKGQGPDSWLNFEASGTLDAGTDQVLAMRSAAPLPANKINRFLNQAIVWSLNVSNQTYFLGISGGHDVFVTIAEPLQPSEVTYRRIDKATEVAARSPSVDPHEIAKSIMSNWNRYNLRTPLSQTGWEWIDEFEKGAQCIDIARFVHGVFNMIGAPGTAETVVISAKPDAPENPVEELWTNAGCREEEPAGGFGSTVGKCALHEYPNFALLDGDWKANAFEAALKLEHGGRLVYYPGGVTTIRPVTSKLEVLHVFRCLAKITNLGCPVCRIDEVKANYPPGPCPPGAVRECWYPESCKGP
jgi:hypothetical protein